MTCKQINARQLVTRFDAIRRFSTIRGTKLPVANREKTTRQEAKPYGLLSRSQATDRGERSYWEPETAQDVDRYKKSAARQALDPATRLNADTHFLSEEEIRRYGLGKRPPGSHPGGFMHEKGRLSGNLAGELFPILPLFCMVSLALGLGVVTCYRELAVSPTVKVKKQRRRTVSEVEDPETEFVLADSYIEDSPFRKLVMNEHYAPRTVAFSRKAFHEPPSLP